MTPRKSHIVTLALAGLELDPRAVAFTNRARTHVKLRHAWPDDTDGRVWHAAYNAARALARNAALNYKREIEIHNARGAQICKVQP